VFASGGDGTVNEVVNGLAGSESALGVVRGGMGDVFAREVGVAREPERALRLLVEGERRRFDLGVASWSRPATYAAATRADGQSFESLRISASEASTLGDMNARYFLLMAGIGFDASVVRRVPSEPKRLLGSTSYALWGLAEIAQFKPRRARVRLDEVEREVDLYWALLGNTRSYGGIKNIASKAKADDGLLDAFVFSGRGLPWVASTALQLARGKPEEATGVSFSRVHEVEVSTRGIAVQADGEYFGETPMRFGVAPGAVEVLLPPGGGRRLLGAE
jgi:diacylglycerol kinase family enzyme